MGTKEILAHLLTVSRDVGNDLYPLIINRWLIILSFRVWSLTFAVDKFVCTDME
ncbi:MAG TPA: hypothetical protein IAB26_10350, partial [Candidatus Limivivens merdigallinarum]|nr:hypothetical protein [Candidatus Limivivens merdigallinarum]